MFDERWTEYVRRSVLHHFDRKITIPVYLEGSIRVTKALSDFVEIRMDGPWFSKRSPQEWYLFFELNCLVQHKMDNNIYSIDKVLGEVQAAYTPIQILDFTGVDFDEDVDLESLPRIVCVKQSLKSPRPWLETRRFGLIDKDLRLEQAMVEGHYDGVIS